MSIKQVGIISQTETGFQVGGVSLMSYRCRFNFFYLVLQMLWDRFKVIGVSDGKSFCEIFSPKEKNDCENQRS